LLRECNVIDKNKRHLLRNPNFMNLIGELTLRLSTISRERDGYKIRVEELTS
jgi:hypothetical protein